MPIVAFESLPGPANARWVLTCEHASEALPMPWPDADRWLLGTHWAIDLGVAAITRQLAARLHAPAVLATVSRLWIDLNRRADDPTLIRTHCDGLPLALNAEVDEAERARRIAMVHVPYHAAVDQAVRATPGADLLSMHSFTPVYEGGPPRPMELGVLFDHDEALAIEVAARLERAGFRVALNEPYSGRGGMMYAVDRHAQAHRRRAIEIEVRQDLATDPERQRAVVDALVDVL